jgi:Ca-activated chloride channel family protein
MRRRTVLSLVTGSLLALAMTPSTSGAGVKDAPTTPSRLKPRHSRWLQETAPLRYPEETTAFKALSQDYQRDAFIQQFWRVRDPYPQTSLNEFRQRWEERREQVIERFGDTFGDRRYVWMLAGRPARTIDVHCSSLLPPLTIWLYPASERLNRNFAVIFRRRGGPDPWQWWQGRLGLEGLADGPDAFGQVGQALEQLVSSRCDQGGAVAAAAQMSVDKEDLQKAFRPAVDLGWVKRFTGRSTDLPADIATFPARVALRYPAVHRTRTVVQAIVEVAGKDVEAAEENNGRFFDFLVDGEILRGQELFENFRYRFHLPAETASGELPLLIERYLRPGAWTLVLKVEDVHGGRYFRTERQIEVPALSGPAATTPARREAATPATPAPPTVAAAPVEPTIELLPLPGDMTTGRLRVAARTGGDGISAVEFWLDGAPVLRKTRPPFSVELNLGHAPRAHSIQAVALDDAGHVLARDRSEVNGGPNRLAVHLLEPRRGGAAGTTLRARAEVEMPHDAHLDRVEFYLNDTRLATLYQPPFIQTLVVPRGDQIAYVRAVACLRNGRCNEDITFLNAPENLGRVDVHLVELYVTVEDRRNHPVDDIAATEFSVREDGEEQVIRRFEHARDLSGNSMVVLDLSTSMADELPDAKKAILGFFENVLSPRDRCSVMTFADRPQLVVPFTGDLEILRGGVTGLQASGETALWDGLVQGLFQFGGLRGKRALIVITDGEDSVSRFSFDEVSDYAAHSGVAIYPIALRLSTRAVEARARLRQLAKVTGGRAFFIDRVNELSHIYRTIEEELHSQYLIEYQSTATEGKGFRRVEVTVKRPGLSARTIPGYYP